MKRFITIMIGVSVLIYTAILGWLYFNQRALIYFPPAPWLSPEFVGLSGFEPISIQDETMDILGWWSPPDSLDKASVIFFHGNASAIYSNHDIYADLQKDGYGVFALAYPGYPGRSGEPSQDSLTQASIQAYDYLLSENIKAEKIAFYGTSLGGGIAAQLTRYRPPSLLIIDASFPSMSKMAASKIRIFPVGLFLKDKFNSQQALIAQETDLLWIHGTSDEVIPFHIGREHFDNYTGPKQNIIVPNGRHMDNWYKGSKKIILERLSDL